MALTKAKELREMGEADLQRRLQDLKEELVNLKIQQGTRQLENTGRINQVKKEIARLLTVVNEQAQRGQ